MKCWDEQEERDGNVKLESVMPAFALGICLIIAVIIVIGCAIGGALWK